MRPFPVLLALIVPASAVAQTRPWLDVRLPFEQRAAALVGRMTLEEKASQMIDGAPAIPRLGVPAYGWWNEALHGVARAGLATSFPQAIGLAATWNDSLIFAMAEVIGVEARAKYHDFLRRTDSTIRYQGLTFWSPNINLFRDPRWGRGMETYGEDPFLTVRLAIPFIRGLQGDDPRYLRAIATVKHYAVHSGPEPERHQFDVAVSERDLRESYLPHFEGGIRSGAWSLMCAYNRVYGAPACGSALLLDTILRREGGFRGYVVSDCGAIDDIYLRHRVLPTVTEAAALGVRSGTDLSCGREYASLVDAVQQGLVGEAQLDTSLVRLFTARMRLGMFDPPDSVPFAGIPLDSLDAPSHRELARRVARESMVLLRNQGGVLPLRRDLGTIAVIGPTADDWRLLLGNYNGDPADPVTPLRGIREAVSPRTRVLHARGSDLADGFPTLERVPAAALRTAAGQPGLDVELFANRSLAGVPVHRAADTALAVKWFHGSPHPRVPADTFSVRWSGTIRAPASGAYRLGLWGTMKYRLYLDDSLVVESVYPWRDGEFPDPRLRQSGPLDLVAGRAHRLRVEAEETYGDADLELVWARPSAGLEDEAVRAARQADAVVLFLGLSPRLEGEEMEVDVAGFRGGDRTTLDLPAVQQRLLERVAAVGKPTVLVLMSGSAVAINWAQENVPAIVAAWYPGQAGGAAIADVLFGDYNPAGRLPVTFYRGAADLPPFEEYAMAGRTYRYFTGTPLYPFGFGLSYTTFGYANLRTSSDVAATTDTITVSFDLTNTGTRAGDEVAQLYVRYPGSAVPRPIRDLRGFRRVHLAPGETRTVTLPLPIDYTAYWDVDGDRWTVESAPVRLQVGASSTDIRLERTLVVAR